MSRESAPNIASTERSNRPQTPDFRFVNYKYPSQHLNRSSDEQNIKNTGDTAPGELAALGRLLGERKA
jgi:hypothetical protein